MSNSMKLKQLGIYPPGNVEILSNCTRLKARVILREFPSSARIHTITFTQFRNKRVEFFQF